MGLEGEDMVAILVGCLVGRLAVGVVVFIGSRRLLRFGMAFMFEYSLSVSNAHHPVSNLGYRGLGCIR